MIDILENKTLEKKCLDKGFIRICDCLPRLLEQDLTCDSAITQAARVSYGNGTKSVNDDRSLIRYLMRNKHTSVFEMVQFKFHVKLPIFTFAQWVRHRSGSFNCLSARYSVMKDEFYIPENIRKQSKDNKQGSEETLSIEDSVTYKNDIENQCKEAYDLYEIMVDEEVTREQARIVLPQNLYTEFYWSVNLKNLLDFLSLRCDSHAQWEIQQYANAILELITPLVPWTIEAWEEYNPLRGAINLTSREIKKLAQVLYKAEIADKDLDIDLNSGNKREDKEWLDKLKKISSTVE